MKTSSLLLAASVLALAFPTLAWGQTRDRDGGSYGGNGGSSGGGARGGYEQDGTRDAQPGPDRGGGGGGGDGGINGITAATLSGLSIIGGRGGDATPASSGNTRSGGGGGAGGYGYVLTATGDHRTSTGQSITGGIGGDGNGTFAGGGGGDGGVGLFLQVGGNLTNVAGASITGGLGGFSAQGESFGAAGATGGTGLLTSGGGLRNGSIADGSNADFQPTFAADVTNAGTITGGSGGSVRPTSATSLSGLPGAGGIGLHLLGIGTLTNNVTGIVTGGMGGAAFGGSASAPGTRGGDGGMAIQLGGEGTRGAEIRTVVNEGRVQGGAGAAGAIAAAGARATPESFLPGLEYSGGRGGDGISSRGGFRVVSGEGSRTVAITNRAGAVITGGTGGNGGSGPVSASSGTTIVGGAGGEGGDGISLFGMTGEAQPADPTFFSAINAPLTATIVNQGTITGGAGGAGGAGASGARAASGFGGDGVSLRGGTLTLTNSGTIRGGDAPTAGTSAAGGVGLYLGNSSPVVAVPSQEGIIRGPDGKITNFRIVTTPGVATITTSGTIAGGLNSDGSRANAILIENGTFTIRLQTGATFLGNVVVNTTGRVIPGNFTFPTITLPAGIPAQVTLDLDGAGTGTVSLPQFQNFGNLTQTGGGGGRWTLTGAGSFSVRGSVAAGTMAIDAGAVLTTPTFSILSGGTLEVNGTLAGTLQVDSGGRLTGVGRLGAATIAGTLAPGNNGIGTMAATGNIIFASSSTYQVDANASGAGDRLTTSGNIVIQGGAVAALAQPGDFALSTRYTILTAGGSLSGTFAGVSANLAFLTPSLTYDAQNAYLSLVRNDIRFPTVAGTFNQRAAAGGSEPLGAGNRVFDALVRLTAAQAPAAFDSLSGEIHASARGALLDDSRFVRDAMLERREAGRGAWASGYGSWGEIESDGNAAALDRDSAGLFAGVNLPLGSSWSAGIAGGYSRASFDGEARASEAQAESWHAAARLMGSFGALRIAAGGAVSFHSIDTARSIVIPGFSDNATARYDGRTLQGFAEASYEIPLGQATIEPFASLAWAEIETEQFQEAGGAAALSGEEASDSTAYSTLGLRTSASLGALSLTGSVGWQHDFESDPSSSNLRFVTGPGTRFTVAGAPTSEDALLVQAGAEFKLGGGAGIGLIYTGQFGDRSDSQGARATLSVPF